MSEIMFPRGMAGFDHHAAQRDQELKAEKPYSLQKYEAMRARAEAAEARVKELNDMPPSVELAVANEENELLRRQLIASEARVKELEALVVDTLRANGMTDIHIRAALAVPRDADGKCEMCRDVLGKPDNPCPNCGSTGSATRANKEGL